MTMDDAQLAALMVWLARMTAGELQDDPRGDSLEDRALALLQEMRRLQRRIPASV